jgi:hypothetical protein
MIVFKKRRDREEVGLVCKEQVRSIE